MIVARVGRRQNARSGHAARVVDPVQDIVVRHPIGHFRLQPGDDETTVGERRHAGADLRNSVLDGDTAIEPIGAVGVGEPELDAQVRGAKGDVSLVENGDEAAAGQRNGILPQRIAVDLRICGVFVCSQDLLCADGIHVGIEQTATDRLFTATCGLERSAAPGSSRTVAASTESP